MNLQKSYKKLNFKLKNANILSRKGLWLAFKF